MNWLLWITTVWSVCWLYILVDAPTLVVRWTRGRR